MAPTLSLKEKKNLYGTKENTTMDMKLFWIFVILNIVNVIIQTIKSLATVKCGKTLAAIANAVAYGLYTAVLVYMVCDLPLWLKMIVVGGCNLVGVYIVKFIEEKLQKERLWEVRATVDSTHTKQLHEELEYFGIPHNYILGVGKYTIFNIYCATKKQSKLLKEDLKKFNAKYFVSESKTL